MKINILIKNFDKSYKLSIMFRKVTSNMYSLVVNSDMGN